MRLCIVPNCDPIIVKIDELNVTDGLIEDIMGEKYENRTVLFRSAPFSFTIG
jgi:hypothetical protein